jgi:SAM-dependent methyltransferase
MSDPSGTATMTSAIQDARNYSDWIYAVARPHLGRSVLEIGPGYGDFAARAIADGKEYRAIDVDAGIIENLRSRLKLGEDRLSVGDAATPEWEKRFRESGIDTVVMLNVVEHLKDDRALLEAAGRCAPNGALVVMVPAHQFLYGSLDSEAGHYRRYGRAALASLVRAAGWNLKTVFYMNGVGAATWFMSARVLKLKLDGEGANGSVRFFDRFIVPWARAIDPCLTWLFGQSVVAVADRSSK